MKNRRNDIERYLRGELSPAEMHALEKEALSDPFLAEALEGVEQAGPDNFLFDLHALNRSLHKRARTRKSKTIKMWGWTAGIAATVLLIAVSGFLVVSLIREQHARQQAMNEESPAPPITEPSKDTITIAMPLETARPARAKNGGAGGDKKSSMRSEVLKPAGTLPAQQPDGRAADDGHLLAENEVKGPVEEGPEKSQTRQETAQTNLPDAVAADKQKEGDALNEGKQLREAETLSRAAGESRSLRREKEKKTAQVPAVSQSAPDPAVVLKGKVVSAEDGEGLPGVNVIVKGTSQGTVTDAEGNYQLTLPALNSRLLFSFIGFEAQEVDVAGSPEVNVRLKAEVDQLSEVVVTAYGNSSNETIEDAASFRVAEPEGGRTAFRRYLLKSVQYPGDALNNKVEGKVTVRFTVHPDGKLADFEVIRGLGHGCDEELMRLIREGPAWKPATQAGTPVADRVKVSLKFQLPR
ncbi:MAG TPA: TonB family protein [Chryseosolibacter sp.]